MTLGWVCNCKGILSVLCTGPTHCVTQLKNWDHVSVGGSLVRMSWLVNTDDEIFEILLAHSQSVGKSQLMSVRSSAVIAI